MPRTPPHLTPSSRWHFTAAAVLFVLICTYSLNGFRPWWTPITLSDANSGAVMRQLIYAGSACLCLLLLWVRGILWSSFRAHFAVACVGLWLLLTAAYSDAPSLTLKRAILFVCGAITLVTLPSLAQHPVRATTSTLASIAGVAAMVSLAWWLVLPADITTNPGRPGLAGISNHPNTLAPALAVGVVAGVAFEPATRATSLMRATGLITCGVALMLTGSITSILTASVMLGVYIALVASPYWRAVGVLLLAGSGTALGLLGLEQIAAEALTGVGRDTSLSGRDQLWAVIWEQIRQAPAFGHGWGAFWTEGKGRELVVTWNPRQSHNAYMDLLLDLGAVGTLLVLAALLAPLHWLWTWARDSKHSDRRGAAAGLSIAVGFFTVYALQQSFLGKVDSFAFMAFLAITSAAASQASLKTPRLDRASDPAGSARSTPSKQS